MPRGGATWFKEDVVAWIVAILLVGGAFAGGHYWLHRRVVDPGAPPDSAVSSPEIVVLAYDRVVAGPDPNKVDSRELREQLEALRDAGFVPVSLAALADFFEQGTPLPARSLLVTFDHGYLSTFSAADPVLRDLGWSAVLFVMTERQSRRDAFFVWWDRVDRMVSSGVWEIGSHGHHGHDPIVVDAEGNEGPFFMRRRWLPQVGRSEDWDEFRRRVTEDHERAKRLLKDRIRAEVLAYATPLRDLAASSDAAEAHRATDEIVRSAYRLAFFDDRFGVNDARTDPHRLKRLRVEPRWSADELVSRVELALDEPRETYSNRSPWFAGSGEASSENGEIVLAGERRADLWRAGSQSVEDWEIEVELRIDGGEAWVVQESDDRFAEWRFGGNSKRTYVQVRQAGERTEVLESFDRGIEPGVWHRIQLVKRGLGVLATLDGEPLNELPTLLPGRWRGSVGLVHWKDEGAPPGMRLREASFSEIPFQTVAVSSELTSAEIGDAIADLRRLSSLSPRLYDVEPGAVVRLPFDETLLSMLSHRFGWEIVPQVSLAGADEETIDALLDAVAADGYDGLRIELEALDASARERVRLLLTDAARERGWREGRLVFSEPSAPIRAGR